MTFDPRFSDNYCRYAQNLEPYEISYLVFSFNTNNRKFGSKFADLWSKNS